MTRRRYDPNVFGENPPKSLPPAGAVRVDVRQESFRDSSNAEIAFYLRLKKTPGCSSSLSMATDTMHLYSEAAHLFVQRMMAKMRGLPAGKSKAEAGKAIDAQRMKMLPLGDTP